METLSHKTLHDFGFELTGQEGKLQYEYLATKSENRHPVHSLHRYYGKLIPAIPRWAIREFSRPNDLVLDPFCGSGTTLAEAKLLGRRAMGLDIDPLACLISRVKTTPLDIDLAKKSADRILKTVSTMKETVPPEFPNRRYWFNASVEEGLAKLLSSVRIIENDDVRNFFFVCLSSIIRDVSRADPRFLITARSKHRKGIGESLSEKDVINKFKNVSKTYLGYVGRLPANSPAVQVLNVDTRHYRSEQQVDLVVTNPPYVGAVDYVRAMRLERYWLKLIGHDLALQKVSIGYDRGNGVTCELPGIPLIDEKLRTIRDKSVNAFRTLCAYFDDMQRCVENIDCALRKEGKIVVKIGDIKLGRSDIELGETLIALGKKVGWTVFFRIKDPIGNRSLFTKRYEKTNPAKIEFDWIIGFKK